MTIFYFIIVLGVLVFIHEFGHFIVAKRAGMCVEKFSLGFGPRIFSYTHGETQYLLSLFPLGGYVKITGQDEEEEGAQDNPRSYIKKTIGQRLKVVLAGPAMNIILALVLMPLVFMIGRQIPAYLTEAPVLIEVQKESPAAVADMRPGDQVMTIGERSTKDWEAVMDYILLHPDSTTSLQIQRGEKTLTKEIQIGINESTKVGYLGIEPYLFIGNEAVIDILNPEGPAARAGLIVGDKITAVNRLRVNSWTDMSQKIADAQGGTIAIQVLRKGQTRTFQVSPQFDKGHDKWLIGIQKDVGKSSGERVLKRYGFFPAIQKGMQELGRLTELTFSVVGRLLSFQLSYKTLGGPIRIAQASAAAAQSGIANLLFFMAFLSLQLGVLNLLPIPVLDGGHVMFLAWEKVMKKPLNQRIRGIVEQSGMVLLLFLMLIVTLNDIDSVWGFQSIFEKIMHIF